MTSSEQVECSYCWGLVPLGDLPTHLEEEHGGDLEVVGVTVAGPEPKMLAIGRRQHEDAITMGRRVETDDRETLEDGSD